MTQTHEPASPAPAAPDRIAAEILRQAAEGGSISPIDVARALAGLPQGDGFQHWLGQVRRVAQRLAREGRIEILRKGKPIDPEELRGVVRLRLRSDA